MQWALFAAAGTAGATGPAGIDRSDGRNRRGGSTRPHRLNRSHWSDWPAGSAGGKLSRQLPIHRELRAARRGQLAGVNLRVADRQQSRQHAGPEPRGLGTSSLPKARLDQPERQARPEPREPLANKARLAHPARKAHPYPFAGNGSSTRSTRSATPLPMAVPATLRSRLIIGREPDMSAGVLGHSSLLLDRLEHSAHKGLKGFKGRPATLGKPEQSVRKVPRDRRGQPGRKEPLVQTAQRVPSARPEQRVPPARTAYLEPMAPMGPTERPAPRG